ncbi:hypothetical protein GCM10023203_39260 [Actinomycetospora straminea]|uniref:Amidase domain-containing protein n=1 Tax=Actinomycetospora straminea TaxID=663607 RepID=A0ABP9EQ54_9PSEU
MVDDVLDRLQVRGDDAVWITVTPAHELRARAGELERWTPAAREASPLYGVPVAVKDNIDVAGLPTTAACPAFASTPARDAGAVRRLRAAGAIVVGKTNLDQFATGLNGGRSPYGAPESVYGGDLVSGGSSSGSAVAVAAGVVPLALGTDTAGSGRVPAALNGVVGLKPTRGLVGARGVVPACRSLDCVSVFTRDLADASVALDVLAGPDPDDPWSRTGVPVPVPDPPVLAVPSRLDVDEVFAGDGLMAEAVTAVMAAAVVRAGGTVDLPLAPLREAGDLLYGGPWVAERLAALGDFLAAHADEVLPVTRGVIEGGARFSAVDAFRARYRLQELRVWADRLFADADVALLPTVPTTFTRAELVAEPVARNLVLGRWTQSTNLLDLAAVAVPAGTTADGRPVGVTLVGPAFSEDRLLAAAARLVPSPTTP